MLLWSPFWRWLAAGVLAAMTIAWVAQTHAGGRETGFNGHAEQRMQRGPGMMGAGNACNTGQGTSVVMAGRDGTMMKQVCVSVPGATVSVNGDGSVAVNSSSMAVSADPKAAMALQVQRAQLQRQEAQMQEQQAQLSAQMQKQQAQLSARMAAVQARLNSLGQ